jgi:hypothetical protein
MNPFDDRFRDAQGNVPAFTGVSSSDQKNAGLLFKKIADLIGAQIPHRGNLRNGIVPFAGSPCLDL